MGSKSGGGGCGGGGGRFSLLLRLFLLPSGSSRFKLPPFLMFSYRRFAHRGLLRTLPRRRNDIAGSLSIQCRKCASAKLLKPWRTNTLPRCYISPSDTPNIWLDWFLRFRSQRTGVWQWVSTYGARRIGLYHHRYHRSWRRAERRTRKRGARRRTRPIKLHQKSHGLFLCITRGYCGLVTGRGALRTGTYNTHTDRGLPKLRNETKSFSWCGTMHHGHLFYSINRKRTSDTAIGYN